MWITGVVEGICIINRLVQCSPFEIGLQAAKEAHKAACMSGMANDDDKDEDGAPDR